MIGAGVIHVRYVAIEWVHVPIITELNAFYPDNDGRIGAAMIRSGEVS